MSEQSQLGPSQHASVMLDIGGDIGALIISTPAAMAGHEIEIGLTAGSERTHVAVRERRGPAGTRYAAIYPALPAGDYTIWDEHGRPTETVTITGGQICELDWTGSASLPAR